MRQLTVVSPPLFLCGLIIVPRFSSSLARFASKIRCRTTSISHSLPAHQINIACPRRALHLYIIIIVFSRFFFLSGTPWYRGGCVMSMPRSFLPPKGSALPDSSPSPRTYGRGTYRWGRRSSYINVPWTGTRDQYICPQRQSHFLVGIAEMFGFRNRARRLWFIRTKCSLVHDRRLLRVV